jgi:sarcosine oxidase
MKRFVSQCLPGIDPNPIEHAVCMYTMTPDEHFVVDTKGRVTYAAGFSGHGFKFATVIGEILAELATQGKTRHPIDFLRYRW